MRQRRSRIARAFENVLAAVLTLIVLLSMHMSPLYASSLPVAVPLFGNVQLHVLAETFFVVCIIIFLIKAVVILARPRILN